MSQEDKIMLTREMQSKKINYIKEKARKEVGVCYEDIKHNNNDVLKEAVLTKNKNLLSGYIKLNEVIKKMENPWFAVSAFIYEMLNQEYQYTEENWKILEEFSERAIYFKPYKDWDYETYLKEMGREDWIKSYKVARKTIMGTY